MKSSALLGVLFVLAALVESSRALPGYKRNSQGSSNVDYLADQNLLSNMENEAAELSNFLDYLVDEATRMNQEYQRIQSGVRPDQPRGGGSSSNIQQKKNSFNRLPQPGRLLWKY